MLREEKGIALVTSMVLTLLALTIVVTAMYLMNLSTHQSGLTKRYKTALQASYGGNDIIVKDLIPQILKASDQLANPTAYGMTISQVMQGIVANYPGLNDLTVGPGYSSVAEAAACIELKLTNPTSAWTLPSGIACSNTLKAKDLPDFKFTVPAAAGSTPYTVYSKIVDTQVGNSDMSGVNLLGAGVADSQNSIVPQHIPYVFRVEVQAERSANATENAALSVLYAY